MKNAELSQDGSPVVVDFFSGQTILGVERVHPAKRELDSSPGRRKAAPLPEVRTANHDFDKNRIVCDMPALYADFQVRQCSHQLLIKPAHPVSALIVFTPRLVIVARSIAEGLQNTFKVMLILKSNVPLDKGDPRRPPVLRNRCAGHMHLRSGFILPSENVRGWAPFVVALNATWLSTAIMSRIPGRNSFILPAIHSTRKGGSLMPVKQGDLGLLQHPASQELLKSKIPARLAYVWTDGSPRVIPIWFHWNGKEIVMGTPSKAPKLKALAKNPRVSLTIDDNVFPHKVLLVRGTARLEPVDGVGPEYAMAAERYFGAEQGKAWAAQMGKMVQSMGRVTVTPTWVGLLVFQTRFPSALPLGGSACRCPLPRVAFALDPPQPRKRKMVSQD